MKPITFEETAKGLGISIDELIDILLKEGANLLSVPFFMPVLEQISAKKPCYNNRIVIFGSSIRIIKI